MSFFIQMCVLSRMYIQVEVLSDEIHSWWLAIKPRQYLPRYFWNTKYVSMVMSEIFLFHNSAQCFLVFRFRLTLVLFSHLGNLRIIVNKKTARQTLKILILISKNIVDLVEFLNLWCFTKKIKIKDGLNVIIAAEV